MRHLSQQGEKRRTCDRCYGVKARCFYEAPSEACHRCDRLGHKCESRRPAKPNGRPPKQGLSSQSPSKTEGLSLARISFSELQVLFHHNANIPGREARLLEFFIHPDQMGRYLYGRTFLGLAQSAITQQLFADPDNLKEGALALAEVFMCANGQATLATTSDSTSHVTRASRALQRLRTLQPTCLHGLHTSMTLALLLLWYNDFTLAQQSLPISRYALLLACRWQGNTTEELNVQSDANIISLLFAEMYECLVRRDIPVFRYDPFKQSRGIDRHYGICDALLPFLYDVCEFSNHQKLGMLSEEDQAMRAKDLIAAIKNWTPLEEMSKRIIHVLPMEDFEKQHLVSQGLIFRLVALLLVETLYPNVDPLVRRHLAADLRQKVLDEIQGGSHGPRYLLFPYFISCLELGPEAMSGHSLSEVAHHMEEITDGLAPSSCRSMATFLEYAWNASAATPEISWFELVDLGPELCIGP